MTTFTQGIESLEFLLSEASGKRSRDQATVTISASTALPSGTVLGRITATGKLIKYLNAAVDGSQTAVAVLGTPLEGVNGDVKALVFTNDCEVIGDRLNGGVALDAPGIADLLAAGIKVR